VLVGAGGVEEVGLAPRGQDQVGARELLPVVQAHGEGGRICGDDLGHLEVDVGVLPELLADRDRDVGRGELRGRHLVQEREELVVVVAVDHRHPHVIVLRELLRAADAREASSNDDDVSLLRRSAHAS
jgi:hypothetical protein